MTCDDANAMLMLIKAAEKLLKVPELQPTKSLYSESILKITNVNYSIMMLKQSKAYERLLESALGD